MEDLSGSHSHCPPDKQRSHKNKNETHTYLLQSPGEGTGNLFKFCQLTEDRISPTIVCMVLFAKAHSIQHRTGSL